MPTVMSMRWKGVTPEQYDASPSGIYVREGQPAGSPGNT
jgi:hypothetical protein